VAGSANDIALVPMDPSGYDSSEPTAMDLVHARRQTGPGLPRVGAARHHLSHALAAPNRAGRGPGCATRGGGIGSAGSHLDCLGRSGFGAASGPVVLPGLHQLDRGTAPREAWVRDGDTDAGAARARSSRARGSDRAIHADLSEGWWVEDFTPPVDEDAAHSGGPVSQRRNSDRSSAGPATLEQVARRALGDDNATLEQRDRVTIDSNRNHTARLFPVQQVARATIFDMRGVIRETGCMVVVRRDQYVAHVLPVHGYDGLADFFAGVLIDAE
jgi:hypothetical protein